MNSPAGSRKESHRVKHERSASFPRLPIRLPDPSTIAEVPLICPAFVPDVVSDEQIARQVHARIAELGETFTGRAVIRVHKGTVFIHGAVQTHYQQLIVTSALRRVCPDLIIRDRIEIVPARVSITRVSLRTRLLNWALRISAAAVLSIICVWRFYVMNSSVDRGLENVTVAVNADGKIANGAFLTLYPLSITNLGTQIRSQGRVDDNGAVSWTTFEPADGLLPGEYVVTAIWNRTVEIDGELQPGPNVLLPIYETPETSPMRLTVNANPREIPTEPNMLSFQ